MYRYIAMSRDGIARRIVIERLSHRRSTVLSETSFVDEFNQQLSHRNSSQSVKCGHNFPSNRNTGYKQHKTIVSREIEARFRPRWWNVPPSNPRWFRNCSLDLTLCGPQYLLLTPFVQIGSFHGSLCLICWRFRPVSQVQRGREASRTWSELVPPISANVWVTSALTRTRTAIVAYVFLADFPRDHASLQRSHVHSDPIRLMSLTSRWISLNPHS